MTGTRLERRLAEELQRHAEAAMQHTDTEQRLGTLLADTQHASRRRRRAWMVAAVAATVVAVVIIVWAPHLRDGRSGTTVPAKVAAPVDITTAFVDAYGAFDRDRAASYLSIDPEPSIDKDWQMENRWFEAVGFKLQLRSCEDLGSSSIGTRVVCAFDYHALHSDELGQGPFSDSVFAFTVRDGKIVAAEQQLSYDANGFSTQMWEPFAAWVSKAHPRDATLMYADWPGTSLQAINERALVLWDLYSREYVNVATTGEPSGSPSP